METLRLSVDPKTSLAIPASGMPEPGTALRIAADVLRGGGTVAFATETVYGLGANALDAAAVQKIFVAKQRPGWDPLIVHIADESMLDQVVATVPEAARALMNHFWPGPLTLLMPRGPRVPDTVTAGRPNVAVRMPAHPVARALIRAAGVPLAAPSANRFGHVSPTTAGHVAADLDGRIDAILDAGEATHGLESTVLDTCVNPCLLYRPGAITLEQLRAVWPAIEAYARVPAGQASLEGLPSPGLGMRHYAPRARLILVEGDDLVGAWIEALDSARDANEPVGLMLPGGLGLDEKAAAVYRWGEWDDLPQLAHGLFAGLRALDDQGVSVIICPVPRAEGLGIAIVDRLRKAARNK